MHAIGKIFASRVVDLTDEAIADCRDIRELEMTACLVGTRQCRMVYAPFDHINLEAKVAIVGLTPGLRQASDALQCCRNALRAGRDLEEALRLAKAHASFSGPMRHNLCRMLDRIGLPRLLGIGCSLDLWGSASHMVHFTSVVRYPVFVDELNWSGSPDPVRTSWLRLQVETYAGPEFSALSDAVFVPLGPRVEAVLAHLARRGLIRGDRILGGLPHPSGSNAERVACFLGTKSVEAASPNTDGTALVARRSALISQMASIMWQ